MHDEFWYLYNPTSISSFIWKRYVNIKLTKEKLLHIAICFPTQYFSWDYKQIDTGNTISSRFLRQYRNAGGENTPNDFYKWMRQKIDCSKNGTTPVSQHHTSRSVSGKSVLAVNEVQFDLFISDSCCFWNLQSTLRTD